MAEEQTVNKLLSGSTVETLCLAVVVAIFVRMLRRNTSRKMNLPPGPRSLPFFGNFLSLARSKIPYQYLIHRWSENYGKVLFFKIFDQGIVILNDADVMQETFQKDAFSDRPPYTPVDDDVGEENCGK